MARNGESNAMNIRNLHSVLAMMLLLCACNRSEQLQPGIYRIDLDKSVLLKQDTNLQNVTLRIENDGRFLFMGSKGNWKQSGKTLQLTFDRREPFFEYLDAQSVRNNTSVTILTFSMENAGRLTWKPTSPNGNNELMYVFYRT